MAGTARVVKRQWSNHTVHDAAHEDAFRVFFEELNNIVTDLETIRAAALHDVTFSQNSGTDSDLDHTAFMYKGASGVTLKAAGTITTLATTTVTALKFGVILVQVLRSNGTVSTKVPGAAQAYDSAALAIAALPAPDTGNSAVAYAVVEADAGNWVANTDDFSTDLTAISYYRLPIVAAADAVAASITTPESQD